MCLKEMGGCALHFFRSGQGKWQAVVNKIMKFRFAENARDSWIVEEPLDFEGSLCTGVWTSSHKAIYIYIYI
jgi:hypothetical protein